MNPQLRPAPFHAGRRQLFIAAIATLALLIALLLLPLVSSAGAEEHRWPAPPVVESTPAVDFSPSEYDSIPSPARST